MCSAPGLMDTSQVVPMDHASMLLMLNLLSKPDTQTSEDVGNCVQPIKGECVYGRSQEDQAFLL